MRQLIVSGLIAVFLAACSGVHGTGVNPLPPEQTAAPSAPDTDGNVIATVPQLAGTSIRDLGASPNTASLAIAVTLRYRNGSDLERLIARQNAAGSSAYHRWLTNEEFNTRFAPSQDDYSQVIHALRRAGMSVRLTYTNRTVVDAVATVGDVERYFGTKIHDVEQAGHRGFVNVSPALEPAELRGKVLSVDGLATIPFVHAAYATVPPRALPPARPDHAPGWPLLGPPSTATGLAGYGPRAFDEAYDLPVVHSDPSGGTFDGRGRASAVVMDADFVNGDLGAFLKYFKIARTGPSTKRVSINGGSLPGDEAPDSIETTLDVETIVGSAPGTALYVYEMPTLSDKNITDAYNTIVSANRVDAVNSSFGGCENLFKSTVEGWNAIAEQGVAKGITFSASSGDSGGNLCALGPASGPYFVAVGGTSLNVGSGGAWLSEIAWAGGGGGVSAVFPQPSWQSGIAGTNDRGRSLPDVALDANPLTGTAFYINGYGWNSRYNPLGGTSLSSPLYVAAVTDIDQVKNGRTGLDAQKIYGLWKSAGYGTAAVPYFHDITVGGNGGFYTAPGYDLVTGIGSLDAWNLGGLF